MAGQPWLKYQTSESVGAPWLKYQVPEEDPNKSPVTAVTTGLIQGAVPFASAIAGAGKAGMDAITGVRGPLAGGSLGDIADDYRSARDSFAGDAKTAAEEHPKTAFASNIAGGFANPLFKAAHSLPTTAAAGGVQALGVSDADLTKADDPEQLKKAALDTGLGVAGGAAGYGAGLALPVVAGAGKSLVKKALTTLGPSEEAITARLAGKAQPSALSYPEIAEDMGKSLKDVSGQVMEKGKNAWQTLSSEPQIPRDYLTSSVDDSINALKVKDGKTFGPASKKAIDVLNSLKSDIYELTKPPKAELPVVEEAAPQSPMEAFKSLSKGPVEAPIPKEEPPKLLSQKDIKGIIQKLDENINWDDQSQDTLNRTLEGLRNKFDRTLKFQNPAYKDAMKPVAQRMSVMDNIRRQFNFRNVPGEGLQPTDTTATKVQTALRENKAVTQKNLQKLKDFTGKDYQDLAKDYQLSQQFENTGPNGSRRTVLGGAVGGLLGHGTPTGIAIGAGAGAILDRYGGQAVGKMIDGYLAAGNSKAFGKFAPIIEDAARRSPEALAVTASMLSTNPEFKKLMGISP